MRQIKIIKSFTNRSEESLDKYLVEISRIPLISAEYIIISVFTCLGEVQSNTMCTDISRDEFTSY